MALFVTWNVSACRADNPLEGLWHEVAQIRCEDGQEFEPSTPIEEIDFRRNGRVLVTWHGFESYYDYRARYSVDADTGLLTLTAFERINYLPPDVDGTGRYMLDGSERLILYDMWFGTWQSDSTAVRGCGHVLERLR